MASRPRDARAPWQRRALRPVLCTSHESCARLHRYILTAAEALKDLVDGFDIDPAKWHGEEWNLPESGNGVPDLLDEMQWELEWMLRMQDSDGGVYHKLTSCNWFFGMPHDEVTPRLVNPKSTHDTGFFAAALAASSRVFTALHPDAAVGARYLAAAVAAWEFLVLHPGNELGEGVPAGGEASCPRLCRATGCNGRATGGEARKWTATCRNGVATRLAMSTAQAMVRLMGPRAARHCPFPKASPWPLRILLRIPRAMLPRSQATGILRAATRAPIRTSTTTTTGCGRLRSCIERPASGITRLSWRSGTTEPAHAS